MHSHVVTGKPPSGGISHNNPLAGSFETLIMLVQGPTLRDAACIWITKYDGYTTAKRARIEMHT